MRKIFKDIEGREQRDELNLYITGYDEDGEPHTEAADTAKEEATA